MLFRQTRVGRDGQLFECLKFRSMVVDAEAQPVAASAPRDQDHGEASCSRWQHDPRITRPGP